jgi:GxxExxY protein
MATAPTMRDPQTHALIGAAMTVHRELGPGFLEAVYVEALQLELADRAIPFQREVYLPVRFKGRRLTTHFRVDLLCFDQVVVEIKALRAVAGPEAAQILNYLKASGCRRGLLLNFGGKSLEYRRFVWSSSADQADCADSIWENP